MRLFFPSDLKNEILFRVSSAALTDSDVATRTENTTALPIGRRTGTDTDILGCLAFQRGVSGPKKYTQKRSPFHRYRGKEYRTTEFEPERERERDSSLFVVGSFSNAVVAVVMNLAPL